MHSYTGLCKNPSLTQIRLHVKISHGALKLITMYSSSRSLVRRQLRHEIKFNETIVGPLEGDVIEADSERLRQSLAAKKHKTQLYLHQWDTTYRSEL